MIREVRRQTIDGVTVLSAPSLGELSAAMLVFRVGRFDETLPTSGITHVVEHLTFSGAPKPNYQYNAEVSGRFTTFYMGSGAISDVADFVAMVCKGLTTDHSGRLDQEKRVLRTEAASRGAPGSLGACLVERYGATGPGLAGYEEYGLRKLDWDQVAAWRDTWFVAGNAVLCVGGDIPADLRIELPDGQAPTMPALHPCPVELPAFTVAGRGLGMSVIGSSSHPAAAALAILQQRLTHELRYERGLSYAVGGSAENLDATLNHAWLQADALPENASMAAHVMLGTFEKLRDAGCTDEELANHVRQAEDGLRSPAGPLHVIHRQAQNLLTERPVREPAETLRLMHDVTSDQVATAARELHATMIFAAPQLIPAVQGRLPRLPQWSSVGLEGGTSYRSPHSAVTLTVGDGVMRTTESGRFTHVRLDQVAALLKWNDGKRTVIGNDGFRIDIDPAEWDGADAAIEKFVASIEPGLAVDVDAPGPARPKALSPASNNDAQARASTRKRVRARTQRRIFLILLAAWLVLVVLAVRANDIAPQVAAIFVAVAFGSTAIRYAEARRRRKRRRANSNRADPR